MSSRTSTIAYIESVIDGVAGLEDVRVVDSIRAIDSLSKPTLQLRTQSFAKLPQAPTTKMLGTFVLVLISPHVDAERAEDQLDDLLQILLPTLFTAGVSWSTATQTAYDDTHLSYDITITSILS